MTKAAGEENSDQAVAEEFVAAEAGSPDAAAGGASAGGGGDGQRPGGAGGPASSQDDGDRSWYGDSAYSTGDLRGAIERAGRQAVIKPQPLRPVVEGGFTVDDFAVARP